MRWTTSWIAIVTFAGIDTQDQICVAHCFLHLVHNQMTIRITNQYNTTKNNSNDDNKSNTNIEQVK